MPLRLATGFLALVLCAIGVLYASTLRQLWAVWWSGEAYQVPALVPWLSLAFVWHLRDRCAGLAARPSARYLPLVALCALAWSVAHAAFVLLGEIVALVAMVHAVALAVLGGRIYRILIFPLWLLWLAVPLGDDVFPPLVRLVVALSEWGLSLTGAMASSDGSVLITAQGRYGVVQECSSLPFVVGNLVVSLVFARLAFDRPGKRIAYVALGVVLAVLANVARIVLVIRITELSGRRIDLASDHGLFGWTLFLLIVGVQLWIGARWCDPMRRAEASGSALPASAPVATIGALATIASTFLLLALPRTLGVVSTSGAAAGDSVAQCVQPIAGLEVAVDPTWSPSLKQADAVHRGRVVAEGYEVDVVAGVFEHQAPGREVVGWETRPHDGKAFAMLEKVPAVRWRPTAWPAPLVERLRTSSLDRRRVWTWYVADGMPTADRLRAKLLLARGVLLGRGSRGAVLMLSTQERYAPEAADHAMGKVLEGLGTPDALLGRLAGCQGSAPRDGA